MPISEEAVLEIRATLLRIADRLESLDRIEELLRDLVEQLDEIERRWQRVVAAMSLAAGNGPAHEE